MAKTISTSQFSKWLDEEMLPGLEEALILGCQEAGAYMEGQVVQSIVSHKPWPLVDRGTMKASVRSYPIKTGAIVEVTAPQAKFMEYGARPHMPPIEPIKEWVLRKRLKPKAQYGPKPPPMFGPVKPPKPKMPSSGVKLGPELPKAMKAQRKREAEATQIAWAIAVNMKKVGIKPTHFFRK